MLPSTQIGDFMVPYAGQNMDPPKLAAQVAHGLVVHPTAGRYARQLPATHSSSLLQRFPHPPQLSGSVLVSTQPWSPPMVQRFIPGPHEVDEATHAPALHSWPEAQTLPQPPQA